MTQIKSNRSDKNFNFALSTFAFDASHRHKRSDQQNNNKKQTSGERKFTATGLKKYEQKPNKITGQWPRKILIFFVCVVSFSTVKNIIAVFLWIIANLSIVTIKSIGPKFRHFKWAFYGLAIFRVAAAFLRILSSFSFLSLILWQPAIRMKHFSLNL